MNVESKKKTPGGRYKLADITRNWKTETIPRGVESVSHDNLLDCMELSLLKKAALVDNR